MCIMLNVKQNNLFTNIFLKANAGKKMSKNSFLNQLIGISLVYPKAQFVEMMGSLNTIYGQKIFHESNKNLDSIDKIYDYFKNINFKTVIMFDMVIIDNSKNKINSTKRKRTNIPRGLRHEVFKRDNYTCKECGASKKDGAILHVDHILPVVQGWN